MIHSPISQTGVRSEEFITGPTTRPQTRGVVMKIRGSYPPNGDRIASLTSLELRDTFNNIPFFRDMNEAERLNWLVNNSTSEKDLYLDDTDIEVKFERISGNNFFTKQLGNDIVTQLLNGNPKNMEGYWPIRQVYNMFPRKPGSRARHHTLVFRPNNWNLFIPQTQVDFYSGIYFNLDTLNLESGKIQRQKSNKIYQYELKLNNTPISLAILLTESRVTPLTRDYLFQLFSEYADINEMTQLETIISWFPPALHKSLIQKVIRTRAQKVTLVYTPNAVLLTSLALLILNPGVFVPNIRRYVSGLESAGKRLAVSIMEDSYTSDFLGVLSMYVGALISQDDRTWQPSDNLLRKWAQIAVNSQKDFRMYRYDCQEIIETSIPDINALSLSYLILKEIRSFQSDINMVGKIALNSGEIRSTNSQGKILKIPLIHCVDHHTFPEILHYLSYPLIYQSYPETLRKIWQQVVGVNPRKPNMADYYETMEELPFVQEVRKAQAYIWIAKSYKPTNRNTLSATTNFEYILDPSWLAGLIGPIEIRVGRSTAIVVLKVSDIYDRIAVKKPSRDKDTEPILTEEESSFAISQFNDILRNGISLTNVPSTLSRFINSTVRLVDGIYHIIYPDGSIQNVEDAFNLKYTFQINPNLGNYSLLQALLYTGNGIDENADLSLPAILTQYDTNVLKRLATYLAGYHSEINLHKISRDGTGVYYRVLPQDTAVNHILCFLCVMYPAVIMKISSGFRVKNGPLLWIIRDQINQHLAQKRLSDSDWNIPAEERRGRWEHQVTSVQQMITRHEKGKKGHLIWIPVGMGKTLIVMDYLEYLIRNNQMPEYCIYSLPSSAIDNIRNEFILREFPIHLIDARLSASTEQRTIRPYMVNLIKHDHMRLNNMDERLRELAGDMIFVVDEFHKTLSKTIRTSIALELTTLSHDFVGLSGTIIKDNNHDELIKWLEQVVEFEVTEKNYWVAVGAMISRRVFTKVAIERQVIPVQMSEEISNIYYTLVPEKLGGTARHIDFRAAANLSYQVVTTSMIDYIYQYNQVGEGVFVVAKDIQHQEELRNGLLGRGIRSEQIFLFSKDNQITLTPEYNGPIRIVITTIRHSEGYTLTKFRILIQSVYFTNQATREQLEGRINRIGQPSPIIRIITLHTGILSYVYEKYEQVRSLSEALRGFAKEVGLTLSQLR